MHDQQQEPTASVCENDESGSTSNQIINYRTCYADTDAGGIVYHGRYIEISERARNSLMNHVGFTFARLAKEFQVMMVTQKVEAIYFAPALLEDLLILRTRLTKCRSAYSIWITDVMRGDELLATVTVKIVLLNTISRKLARHPELFVAGLSKFVEE